MPPATNHEYPITVVSGYWAVNSKNSNDSYWRWHKNSLRINAPYVFFGAEETLSRVADIRSGLPTSFQMLDIPGFVTSREIDLSLQKSDPINVPSVDLGRIWLEKVNLMSLAADSNPFDTEWFAWIDSGLNIFRHQPPPEEVWPSPDKLRLLSKTRVNYSQSHAYNVGIKKWGYFHCISGGAFVVHRSMVAKIRELFYRYVVKCIEETQTYVCLSDQCIFTRMFSDHPGLFNRLSTGYGKLVPSLYENRNNWIRPVVGFQI